MARQSRWWRPRDVFPRTTAVWIQSRRAPHHARLRVKSFFESPSLWTTSVMAGMLAIVLTLLLFVVGPPPEVALEPVGSTASAPEQPAPVPRLELAVQHGAFPVWWNEHETHFVQSQPEPPRSPIQFAFADSGWTRAGVSVTAVAAEQPVPLTGRLVLPTADDPPFIESSDRPATSPLVASDAQLGIAVEKVWRSEGGRLQEYALIVRNRSSAAIDRVVVREEVPDVNQLVNVEPRAFVSRGGELLWQIGTMEPGEELEFNVSYYLRDGEESFATQSVADVQSRIGVVTLVSEPFTPEPVAVTPEPAVTEPEMSFPEPALPAGLTEVPAAVRAAEAVLPGIAEVPESRDEPPGDAFPFVIREPEPVLPATDPPLADGLPAAPDLSLPAGWPPLDRTEPAERRPQPLAESVPLRPRLRVSSDSPASVARGEVVTTIYEISNDGTAAAENVTLTVHVTEELLHRHGADVKHTIDRLEPGETRRARLLTRARTSGTATLDAALTYDGDEADSELSYVRVTTTGENASATGEALR